MNPPNTGAERVSRRRTLQWLGIASVLPLANCGGSGSGASAGTSAAAQSDAALAGLNLSAGTLDPVFDATTTNYSVAVYNSVASVTVTPTAADTNATIRVNGNSVGSGTGVAISLAVGTNAITIDVSAATATTRTYTVTITRAAVAAGVCALIPQETQGPFPLLSILSNAAIVREDITEGEAGVPLTLILNLVDLNAGCAPITDAAVYVWHCDKDGNYSGYGNFADETFLRGVQSVDSAGQVRFTTIFPGWYAGRITHIHFQVYLHEHLEATATATSQLGFPQAITQTVYSSSKYAARGQNTSVSGFAQDNVFSDGTSLQIATVNGDTGNGLVATLQVGIAG